MTPAPNRYEKPSELELELQKKKGWSFGLSRDVNASFSLNYLYFSAIFLSSHFSFSFTSILICQISLFWPNFC